MNRTAGKLALLPVLLLVLLLGTACRDNAAPTPGVDQQVSDVESTLDAVESELGGDG